MSFPGVLHVTRAYSTTMADSSRINLRERMCAEITSELLHEAERYHFTPVGEVRITMRLVTVPAREHIETFLLDPEESSEKSEEVRFQLDGFSYTELVGTLHYVTAHEAVS